MRSKKRLVIDFGNRSIKIVEGRLKRGKLTITKKLLIELPNGVYENGYIRDKEFLKEIIDSALTLNDIKRRDTVGVINSSDIIARSMYVPDLSSPEMAGVIQYTIDDYIPIDLDNYVIQFISQGYVIENGTEQSKLFIIAVPNGIRNSHYNFLKSLNLKPGILDFQSNSIGKLLTFMNEDKIEDKTEKNIANIDIGFSSTKITILENLNIKISKTIFWGIKDLLENLNDNLSESEILEKILSIEKIDEEICEVSLALKSFLIELFENLDMVFKYYSSLSYGNNIDLILLQGRIVKWNNIFEQFEKHFNIKTISIDSYEGFIDDELYLYSNAIGSLIRDDE